MNNKKNIIEKALLLLLKSDKSGYQIWKDTGITEATIGNYRNRKTKPTEANANILIKYFEQNEGSMLKGAGKSEEINEINYVLLLPTSACAGSLNDFVVSVKDTECEKIISPIKGVDWAVTISGDSMEPEYPSGSQILIKKINEKAFIDWGKVYVLDTCNGSVIKKIFPTDDKDPGKLKCVSINPEYPPFDVSLNDVFGVYRVLLCMSVK